MNLEALRNLFTSIHFLVCSTGQSSSRSDHQSVSDGGDVSPACSNVGNAVWDPSPSIDMPLEESHEKDR